MRLLFRVLFIAPTALICNQINNEAPSDLLQKTRPEIREYIRNKLISNYENNNIDQLSPSYWGRAFQKLSHLDGVGGGYEIFC